MVHFYLFLFQFRAVCLTLKASYCTAQEVHQRSSEVFRSIFLLYSVFLSLSGYHGVNALSLMKINGAQIKKKKKKRFRFGGCSVPLCYCTKKWFSEASILFLIIRGYTLTRVNFFHIEMSKLEIYLEVQICVLHFYGESTSKWRADTMMD